VGRVPLDCPELLTVAELAALLRTTPNGVQRRLQRGRIPAHVVVPAVSPRLFYAERVRAWLDLPPRDNAPSAT
jgi:hypothetical protein